MQKQLLEKWARVDLRAALDAMNTMAWQEEEYYSTTDAPWNAFSQIFSERPDEAWDLLQSGRYGLAAGRLRWEWMISVSKSDGALVISKLNDMPPGLRNFAIFRSIENQKTGAEIEAMAAKVIALAGDGNQEWLQAVANITGNPASNPFTDSPDLAAQREGWMKLPEGPARQMALLHWEKDLGKQEPATITGELAAIPPDAREAVAGVMMSQVFNPLPVVLLKLDFAMKTASWDTLTQSKLETIVNRFADTGDTDPKETAAWALTLPQRKGTPEIYQAAVTAYISEDTSHALEWLEGLEEGSWQKDNALAVYSRQMLEKHGDSEASQWALDAITDPKIRAQLDKWKHERELRLKDYPHKDKW